VSRCSSPYPRQSDEENQDRQQGPAVRRALQESDAGSDGGGGEYREKQGMVEPAKRFRIDDAKLHEYAEREVRKKEDQRDMKINARSTDSSWRVIAQGE
jgi:hypothetical protein